MEKGGGRRVCQEQQGAFWLFHPYTKYFQVVHKAQLSYLAYIYTLQNKRVSLIRLRLLELH